MTILNWLKALIITGSLIGLSACSPNSGNNSQPTNNDIARLEAKSGSFTGVNDFGTFAANATSVKIVTFTLLNNGTDPLTGPAVLEDSSAFTLAYSNCPVSLAKTKSCTIKISLDPRTLPAGSYSTNLTFDVAQVALIAIKESPAAPTGPVVQYSSGSSVINSLDFGNITDKQNVLKTVTIKNISAGSINELATLTGDYTLSYDSCSGKAIAKGSSCSIKITLNGSGKNGDVLGDLSYAGLDLPLSGNVTSIASGGGQAGSPNIIFLQDNNTVLGTVDEGAIYPAEGKQVILTLKNSGTLASIADTAISDNTMFQIVYNQCTNKSLAVNATCQVRVLISGQNTTAYGVKTGIISFAGASVTLSVNILDPAGVATYVPGYSDYGSCSSVLPCEGSGTQSRILTSCQKMVNNIPVTGATLADCAAFNTSENLQQSCPSPAGTKTVTIDNGQQVKQCALGSTVETLVSTSCSAEFHEQNNTCVADVITYSANYSEYGNCSASQPCDGVGTKNRTMESCQKYRNGIPEVGGQISDCSAYNTTQYLQTTCDSPAGDLVTDILDLGIQAGTLTVTCPAGGMLPGTNRVASCSLGFEQSSEQCIKLNTLQISKSLAAVGSISVTGASAPISCDTSCAEVNAQVRRDQSVNISFSANSSNQYAFDNFTGDTSGCVGLQCTNVSLSANKSLTINTHARKLVVMQETAGYSLSATGTGLFVTTAPTPTAGFTQAKAYYVEANNNFGVSISVVGGTNVNTGWYIDNVKQPAPVGNTIGKTITADTTFIHATTGPTQQACGNTVGDYFGVASGQGKQTWNATTGLYSTRCIPNNSSSCIAGSQQEADGLNYTYIYKTASLFPVSDTQDPDPAYPYASGACVKSELSCTSTIPNATQAGRYTYGGENSQYTSCEVSSCANGYKSLVTSCAVRKIYLSGAVSGGSYNVRSYDFSNNTFTLLSNINASTSVNQAPTLYDVGDSGNVYLTSAGTIYKNSTPIANLDNAQSDPSTMVAMEGSNKLFFNYNDFTQGMETFYTSINNTTRVNPTVISYVASTTNGNGTNSQLITDGNWLYLMGLTNTTHGLEWGRINPTNNAVDAINTVAGATAGLDNSAAVMGIANKPWLFDGSFIYYVGLSGGTAGNNEIMRISTINPTSPGTTLFAEVVTGTTGSAPGLLTKWNNNLWFKATNGASTDLYYKALGSGGTTATKLSSFSATSSANIGDMVVYNNKLYVSANINSSVGMELYEITDNGGGNFSVALAADISPGVGSSSPKLLVENGEGLYFIATDPVTGLNFMKYNGSTVTNLSTMPSGVYPANPQFNAGKHKLIVK